jgi:glucosamine-6-phosphate deaminase
MGPAVTIHPDVPALARAAADDAAAAIRAAVAGKGIANVMFATGNSQLAFIAALTGATPGVPWQSVTGFHMDEYVGAGPDHPAGFRRWIRERIADQVPLASCHYVDGLADPAEECARYTALLREHPLDLCCLGIGENGHLAFNDPPADFDDPADVKVVELDRACRRQQVGEGHFPDIEAVPTQAITVTVPALLRAGRILAIVPDLRKAEAVRNALQGPVSPSCPASALQNAPHGAVYLDAESASRL